MIKKQYLLLLIFITLIVLTNFSSALSISIHVPEKYTTVNPGERFYFEVEVKYPENPVRKDLTLEYDVFEEGGKKIANSKILKAIETQASFMDFIVIPENAKQGLATIQLKIKDYDSLNKEVSATFQIIKEKDTQLLLYIIIILGIILAISMLVIVQLILNKRKNEI